MMTKIYDLAYEINGDTINLEQDMGCGEVSRIDLHPVHLRLLAEEAGILAPSSNIECDHTIARLSRQLRSLANRIDRLDTMMLRVAEKGHECVDEECAYSAASLELAQEFVYQLDELWLESDPKNGAVAVLNAPEIGVIPQSNPPKSGAVSMPSGAIEANQRPLGLEAAK